MILYFNDLKNNMMNNKQIFSEKVIYFIII